VEFINASVLGRMEEGASPVSEEERSTRGGFWFPCGGMTGGCRSMSACGDARHPDSGGVWIDLRWKTISWVRWAKRLMRPDTVVEIKLAAEIEWAKIEKFLDHRKIVEKKLCCCSLNKKFKLLNEKQRRLESSQALEYF
jgi:hypothetical protein